MSNLYLLLCSLAFIALRSFQQLNVVHDRRLWVIPTSALMSICEVSAVLTVIRNGWWSWIPMWIGGSLGCLMAMAAHRRWRR